MIRPLMTGIIMVLLLASVSYATMVSVDRPTINMRSGPGKEHSVIWELGYGFPLKTIERRGNWLKVSDFEDDIGWVYHRLVSREPHLIVKKRKINIRSGPGTRHKIVGQANYGVVLRTLKRGRGWVQVKHENGLSGWVQRSLLWGW